MVLGISIFIFLIILSIYLHFYRKGKNKIKIKREWELKKFLPIRESMESVKNYWEEIQENTFEYKGVDSTTWNDLDMDEVFSKINYTKSSVGSEYLYNKLHSIDLDETRLLSDEKNYKLLMNNQSLHEQILLILMGLGKEDYSDSASFFQKNFNNITNIYLYVSAALLPIISILLIIFSNVTIGITLLSFSLFLNFFIYYKNKMKLESNLHATSYASKIIYAGKRLTKIDDSEFKIYSEQIKCKIKPIRKIMFFEKIVSIGRGTGDFDVFFEYIRIAFLLDFISYYNMIKIISKYKENYRYVWRIIGELDSAISVVFYRHTLDYYSNPEFWEKEEIQFSEMYHPLIIKPVANSALLKKGTLLTGSNASGKSSFIKAVAINSIFAQTINTTLSRSWKTKKGYVITSMAIKDNVLNGDSYFKAEIKSLKRIIEAVKKGDFNISIIDEILKGTNTIERVSSSAAMIKWLSGHNGINIIASHDIELSEMSKKIYHNFHFKESVKNGSIDFDYKIKKGPTTTKNAIKLLEVFNYPPQLVSTANTLSSYYENNKEWKDLFAFDRKIM